MQHQDLSLEGGVSLRLIAPAHVSVCCVTGALLSAFGGLMVTFCALVHIYCVSVILWILCMQSRAVSMLSINSNSCQLWSCSHGTCGAGSGTLLCTYIFVSSTTDTCLLSQVFTLYPSRPTCICMLQLFPSCFTCNHFAFLMVKMEDTHYTYMYVLSLSSTLL